MSALIRLTNAGFGYSGRVLYQTRKDNLTFPTQLRYTTFRAVSPKRTESTEASTRDYSSYRFFKTASTEHPGGTKSESKP